MDKFIKQSRMTSARPKNTSYLTQRRILVGDVLSHVHNPPSPSGPSSRSLALEAPISTRRVRLPYKYSEKTQTYLNTKGARILISISSKYFSSTDDNISKEARILDFISREHMLHIAMEDIYKTQLTFHSGIGRKIDNKNNKYRDYGIRGDIRRVMGSLVRK